MKPSYTDFDRVKCIASTENQKQSRKPLRDVWSSITGRRVNSRYQVGSDVITKIKILTRRLVKLVRVINTEIKIQNEV